MKESKHEAPALNEPKGWYHNHIKHGDAIPANSRAKQIQLLATSNTVHTRTVAQCTLYIPLAKGTTNSNHTCPPQVRKGLKKPPLSFIQKSSPKRIHLERMCSPPTLADFPSVASVPSSCSTVLSREYSRWGQDSPVLHVSCSPTVRDINALAPSLLVPNFCPDAGCHLLAHRIETAAHIHWDLLLKLKSDSQEPTSLEKCSNLRDKLLPAWLTNDNN